MGLISRKKLAIAAGATSVVVGGTVAFAYFTTTGGGSGTGTVGTSSAMTIHQVGIVYSNASSDNAFVPGTSATVTFSVDNPSSGHQLLNTIHLASVTSNKSGCDSVDQPTWFTMPDVTVNKDYGAGNGQAVTPTGTITFNNDPAASQDACKGATLTFNYTSN
jgi:hypothetical protein